MCIARATGSRSETRPSAEQEPEPLKPIRPPSPASAEKHRARLRGRLLTCGPDALVDHELLEIALFLATVSQDTKLIANRLIGHFGSFANAVSAPKEELLRVRGVGWSAVAALKVIQAAAQRLSKAEVMHQPVLSHWNAIMDYLNAQMARERVQQFRILFLDNRNRLLADEAQARGTVNDSPVYPREAVKRALELNATAMVLVHNHPNGDPTPSRDDIIMTQQIVKAAQTVSLIVHDHVIVGNGRWVSLKREGLI